LANYLSEHSEAYIGFAINEAGNSMYSENGVIQRYKINSYTGNVLTIEKTLPYTGTIYAYRIYSRNSETGNYTYEIALTVGLTDKGIVPKTSLVYLSVTNGTTTLIDKKKILTYTADKKLTIEGGVSILLSDSDLNSLTYTAYNYISNTYTELGKTGDGKIIASDPTGGTVSGPVKYRWGPKNGSGKEESDYIWMPDSQAVKQTNMA
jgi:hypothetical protein